MIPHLEHIYIEPIHEKYVWRLCDFCTINQDRLKRFFTKTLEQNLTPELSKLFAETKVRQFAAKEEFLFVLKEKEDHTLVGMVYIKEVDWDKKQGELAYAIGYREEGKGTMTKAVQNISDWAFNELKLETLQIISHKTNLGSVRVAEKCGYLWKRTLIDEHTPPNEAPLNMELYELNHEG